MTTNERKVERCCTFVVPLTLTLFDPRDLHIFRLLCRGMVKKG